MDVVRIVLATVPGYLAAVWVRTDLEAPVPDRYHQGSLPSTRVQGGYPDRTSTHLFLAGLELDRGSILQFLQHWQYFGWN